VIGVYAFRPVVFEVIEKQRPSARGELEIADTINGLLERGLSVDTAVTAEEWIDTGKMEDMLAANRTILSALEPGVAPGTEVSGTCEGPVRIEAGASVVDCVLRGPVAIGAGARLRGSSIGPNVAIGRDCIVEFSTIENSIVMEETEIRDCPGIADSMIGRFVHVSGAPAGARLTLGDHSRFEGAG
jgi:glucose-1-phosphate thymidylyltransferase